ncbi:MAG: acyltransferase family protein [Thermosipho sp. (in: Bacteria)]|nr:acyltransferase family protein [Thermosipho sp. (in: thermotogales)]
MRIREIDISRGILILIVVFVHSHIPYSIVVYISYFLSTFMFISGYLYKDENFSVKLKKIVLNLWIPFVFLSSIGYVIFYIINKNIGYSDDVFSSYFNFLLFGYAPIDMPVNVLPLWYLYMFAIAEVLFLLFYKLRLIHVIPLLSILTTLFVHKQTYFFKIEIALHGLLWFYLGFLVKSKGFKFKIKKSELIFIISFVILIIIGGINGLNDWRDSNWGEYPILSYIGEGSFILLVISFSNMIKKEGIKRFFELFGRYTIFILGYHMILPGFFAPLLKDPLSFVEKYWYIYFLISTTILYYFLKFVPKNFIHLLSGQFHLLKSD